LEFYDKCIKKNIKPIIGVEIFLNKEKVIIIAKNYKGYKNMILLYSLMQQNKKININEYSDLLVLRTCENFLKCCIFEQGKETILKTLYAIKKSTLLKNIYLTKNELNSFLLNKDNYTQFYTPEQLKKIEEIIKSIDLTIENEELDFVSITPEPKKKILEECLIGLKKRLKTTTYPKSYSERLIQELDVIKKLNFCDYFLVVADYIN
jgi:DNA polymerase-3 subunit alpha